MSQSASETLVEGEVERVTFENDDTGFRVVKLAVAGRREPLTVVGSFARVGVGARIRVRGALESNTRHGQQLRALSVTELLPDTLVGVERYLGSGIVRGVGEVTAKRIVQAFGMDTLRILDEQPERLRQVEGLGRKRAEAIRDAWSQQRALREVMVFLQAHGASGALAARIYKRHGKDSVRIVSRDPYRLALDVWGIGFKTADRIAESLGTSKDAPARLQAGVLQTLHDATEAGHACVEHGDLMARSLALLELAPDAQDRVEEALGELVRAGHAVVEHDGERRLVFSARAHGAETRLAQRVAELAAARARALPGAQAAVEEFERRGGVELAAEQRAAIDEATARGILIITGGPGVGKTTIVRAILSVFDRARLVTRLAAPTGRAAKRLGESTGREASTLHRLLEFDPKRGAFKLDARNPVQADVLIVDEASMIDLWMADALTQAVADGTRVILVGDVDQLPSVGPGAVLRDLIASGAVPTVRLVRIFRQESASLIVESAHKINAGEAPEPSRDPSSDFFMVERADPEAAQRTVIELVTERIPRRFGLDPLRDIQVLTPMHRGPAGSISLNEALQEALNPASRSGGREILRGTRRFRAGDRVMQLKNDYDREVWNGDVGIVARLDDQDDRLYVRFDEREVIYDAASLDELSLAYAISIHKAQGSEYPAVVLPLLTTHFIMLSKSLLYTAVTRGKRLVVLVYAQRALALSLAQDRRGDRLTRLEARLRSRVIGS